MRRSTLALILLAILVGFLLPVPCRPQTRPGRATAPGSSSVPSLVAIIPVAISSPGKFDSLFKTEMQVHNPNGETIAFRLVFHPAGVPGKSTDPSLDFSIPPLATVNFADLLPAMGQSGIGSIDIFALSQLYMAAGVVRVFNDAGAAGTSGFTEPFLTPEDYLDLNTAAVLICPADPSFQRLNVGVRTMEEGANVEVYVRDGSGNAVSRFTRSYPPVFFEQTDVLTFLNGLVTQPNYTITVHPLSGGLYVYGVSADNRTNDPSMQVPDTMPSTAPF